MCYNKLEWGGKVLPKTLGSKISSLNLRVCIQSFCFVVSKQRQQATSCRRAAHPVPPARPPSILAFHPACRLGHCTRTPPGIAHTQSEHARGEARMSGRIREGKLRSPEKSSKLLHRSPTWRRARARMHTGEARGNTCARVNHGACQAPMMVEVFQQDE